MYERLDSESPQQDPWSWKSWAVLQGAVVISMMVRRRRCSHCGLRYLSPWQRSEAVDVTRPPRRVARISGCHGTEMGVCVEASLDQRARRLCLCSLSVTVPWWRSSGGRWSLQRVCLGVAQRWWWRRRCRWFVSVFSPMWSRMVMCCVGCVCLCSGVYSCGGVCFYPLCTNVVSSYMT
jgi:hypothetical protein